VKLLVGVLLHETLDLGGLRATNGVPHLLRLGARIHHRFCGMVNCVGPGEEGSHGSAVSDGGGKIPRVMKATYEITSLASSGTLQIRVEKMEEGVGLEPTTRTLTQVATGRPHLTDCALQWRKIEESNPDAFTPRGFRHRLPANPAVPSRSRREMAPAQGLEPCGLGFGIQAAPCATGKMAETVGLEPTGGQQRPLPRLPIGVLSRSLTSPKWC
jgi:hypothetical protein